MVATGGVVAVVARALVRLLTAVGDCGRVLCVGDAVVSAGVVAL